MLPNLLAGDIILINKLSKNISANKIYVFEKENQQHVSRVVGLPGDKLEISNGILLINDVEQLTIETLFTYKVLLGEHPPLSEYDLLLKLQPLNNFEEYTIELTEKQANKIADYDFVKSINKVIHPRGYRYSFKDNPIFPHHNSFKWSRDNFGPIMIPKKGDQLESKQHIVNNNYYFVMGDNRHQSLDSRYFGFVAEENIIGEMILTLYSPNE